MLGAALHASRQLLIRPGAFFDERDPASTLPIAAGLVVLLAIALVVSMFLLSSMIADSIDGPVTVDNPDRPADWVCDRHGDDPDSPLGQGCDEPETIERDAGSIMYDVTSTYVGYVLIAPFLLWLLGGIVLYVAARIANGTPSLGGAFALAGWAALPELFRLVVGVVAVRYALVDVTVTDLERLPSAVEAALVAIEPILALATVVTVCWQWYLLTGGMTHDADLEWRYAALAVGVPLVIWLLVVLV